MSRSDEVKIKTNGEESEKQEEQTRLTIEEEYYNCCHSTNYRSYPLEDVHIYETGDMTQTIDCTHYEMIETDRQGNKAYINVDIKKYKIMCTMIIIIVVSQTFINKQKKACILY